VRPGLTGPGTLKFAGEERLLATTPDPEDFKKEVLWPAKVRENVDYVRNYRWWSDIAFTLRTALFLLTLGRCCGTEEPFLEAEVRRGM